VFLGPERISVFGQTHRTNNGIESYHASLQRRIKTAHPNIYCFLQHLQNVTVDAMHEVGRLQAGMRIRRPKKKAYVLNDKRIQTITAQFIRGDITRYDFLRAASHNITSASIHISEPEVTGESSSEEDPSSLATTTAPHTGQADVTQNDASVDPVCEACFLLPRARVALVPCGHSRFCCNCVAEMQRLGLPCPICNTAIIIAISIC